MGLNREKGRGGSIGDRAGNHYQSSRAVQYFTQTQLSSSNNGSTDVTHAHAVTSVPGTEEASTIREHGGETLRRHEIRGFKTTSIQLLCAQIRGGARFLRTSHLTSHGQSSFAKGTSSSRLHRSFSGLTTVTLVTLLRVQ